MWLPGDWKDKPGIQGFVVIFQARLLQQTQTTLLGGALTTWKRFFAKIFVGELFKIKKNISVLVFTIYLIFQIILHCSPLKSN